MKEIPLTRGAIAIVDDDMFEYLNQFNWHLNTEGYAQREIWNKGNRIKVRMHREILGTPVGMDTDHINNNRLDNRRENLRVCTRSENLQNSSLRSNNTSGYKGVSYFKHGRLWMASLYLNKKLVFCKYFHNPEDAARAYNEAAKKYFGEFAKLNIL
jgi:hypothetical protein